MPETSLQRTLERMRAMKYEVGDMVRISHESMQHGDEIVIITGGDQIGETPVYDWIIPEQRGSVPEHLIRSLVARGITACLKIASKN